jgi:arabinogalactan oligomer/maltooligosaccharide transport system permease protein
MYRSPPGARGFLLAIGLLGGALLAAFLLALLIYAALQTRLALPGWLVIVLSLAFLIPLLVLIARRFPFITDWYYLLPAITFLLAFTVYPIVLTVYFGFTDYTGQRNGKPDRSTETEIVSLSGTTLTLADSAKEALRCRSDTCAGERIELTLDNRRTIVKMLQVEGNQIQLESAPAFTPKYAYRINEFRFIGFGNFVQIFSQASKILWPVFVWNVVFALGAVVVGVIPGLILGLLLNNKDLKLRGFYRTTLIISWAMPVVISAQIWQGMLNVNFGPINRFLGLLGANPVPWLIDPEWAKVALLLTTLWLGLPYWMTATLGALSTISDDVYEAAKIDGASSYQMLTGITLPLLRQPFIPLVLGSFAHNFNNFGIVFLLTGGGPAAPERPSTAQGTDILISWAYKTAFQTDGGNAYGLGGAISIIIFFLTVLISLINFRFTGALKEVR